MSLGKELELTSDSLDFRIKIDGMYATDWLAGKESIGMFYNNEGWYKAHRRGLQTIRKYRFAPVNPGMLNAEEIG